MSAAATAFLWETTFSETPQVDRKAGIIRGVKILGRTSRNQRIYSPEALQAAARLYEGLGVNVDHPRHETSRAPRQVADGLGWLAGVHVTDEGVYGDLHYLRTHPQAAMIAEAAERNPRRFGLSHNAEGRVVRKAGQWVVESVEQVHSVDVVQNPATNRGLFESCLRRPLRTLSELCELAGCRQILSHPRLAPLGDLPVDSVALPRPGAVTLLREQPDETPRDDDDDGSETTSSPDRDQASIADVLAMLLPALAHRLGQPSATELSDLFRHLADTVRPPTGEAVSPGEAGAAEPTANVSALSMGPVAESLTEGAGGRAGGEARDTAVVGASIAGPERAGEVLTRLARIETELHCRGLLEQAGRAIEPERLGALAALPDDSARRALLETWPTREPARSRPATSPPRTANEFLRLPGDVQGFVAALR